MPILIIQGRCSIPDIGRPPLGRKLRAQTNFKVYTCHILRHHEQNTNKSNDENTEHEIFAFPNNYYHFLLFTFARRGPHAHIEIVVNMFVVW